MRIIAGSLKGRLIQSPKKFATHPMSEKVRGALFNALGDISGLSLLDAYAGSGAIAIEAASRGAKSVLAIDSDQTAARIVKENVRALGLGKTITVAHANCVSYLANQPGLFDIVVCDPPYNNVKISQLKQLAHYVSKGGLLVLSLPPSIAEPVFDGFELMQQKSYGDATLWFYRYIVK